MNGEKLQLIKVDVNELYSLPQIADMLGVHRSTINRKCHSGALKAKNIGTNTKKIFRVSGKDLLDYLNN